MLKRLLGAALITLCLTAQANAMTGDDIHKICQMDRKQCELYTAGIIAGLFTLIGVSGCIPDDVSALKVRDIFLEYIEKTPEKRSWQAPIILDMAMNKAFNCPLVNVEAFKFIRKKYGKF